MFDFLDAFNCCAPQKVPDKSGGTAGVGIGFALRPNGSLVVDVLAGGGPAERTGQVFKGDWLRAVDGVSVKGKQVSEVVQMLRGPPDSDVTLLLDREGSPVRVHLVRSNPRASSSHDGGASDSQRRGLPAAPSSRPSSRPASRTSASDQFLRDMERRPWVDNGAPPPPPPRDSYGAPAMSHQSVPLPGPRYVSPALDSRPPYWEAQSQTFMSGPRGY